jgi:copper chaperone
MNTMTLRIEGMSCAHCVARVEKALGKLEGVQVEKVEIGSAKVRYDASRVSPERIGEAVEGLGYGVHEAGAAA